MKYYVMADIHSYYSEMIEALDKAGYFKDQEQHKIIICGDLFDRGSEALKLQEFILNLLDKDEIILIKGNHEDLMIELLDNWHRGSYFKSHHQHNKTIDTVVQLLELQSDYLIYHQPEIVYQMLKESDFITKIIPKMINYYETKNYIFVHGWIPCDILYNGNYNDYLYLDSWRDLGEEKWEQSRWINGMNASFRGVNEKDKTIVCGHWHCSYGHATFEMSGSEFGYDANFLPYYNKGIIAIDGCTARSGIVNCIVIED